MTSKQLTVLTGNSALQLSNVISHLSSEGIDIRAHCAVENGDGHCKLRMIVTEPDRAIDLLRQKDITAVANDVVIVETDDKPGGLSRMLGLLEGDASTQVQYTYTAASAKPGIAVMVFRFSDNRRAAELLSNYGLKPIEAQAGA
jgi:hypothetical protein